jgi:hypothetical protein
LLEFKAIFSVKRKKWSLRWVFLRQVDDEIVSQIGRGLLLFVGFSKSDVASDAESVYVFPNVCPCPSCRSHSEGRNTRDMMDTAYGVVGVKSCDEKSSYFSL